MSYSHPAAMAKYRLEAGRSHLMCPVRPNPCSIRSRAAVVVVGTCLFAYGLKQGEICRRDNDCETGLLCTESAGEGRTCQPPISNKKQYSEDCTMSGECDIGKGLCCQLQRRHRQAARKVCSYFKDPLICIGPVATDQVKDDVEHTAGEKRLTGKAASFNHLRRK